MKFDVLTLFPEMFEPISKSIIGRAVNNQLLERSYANVNQIGIIEQDRRLIDPDGEYRIMSVTHSGDTYGDTWQTEAIGVGRNRTIKDMAIVL